MQSCVLQGQGAIAVPTAVQGHWQTDTEPPEARHCCSEPHCRAPAKKAKLLNRMDGDTNSGARILQGFSLLSLLFLALHSEGQLLK